MRFSRQYLSTRTSIYFQALSRIQSDHLRRCQKKSKSLPLNTLTTWPLSACSCRLKSGATSLSTRKRRLRASCAKSSTVSTIGWTSLQTTSWSGSLSSSSESKGKTNSGLEWPRATRRWSRKTMQSLSWRIWSMITSSSPVSNLAVCTIR